MSAGAVDVLAELSAVLDKHGASLFFGSPAELYLGGERIGEVWEDDEGDGSRLVFVDPALAAEAEGRRHG